MSTMSVASAVDQVRNLSARQLAAPTVVMVGSNASGATVQAGFSTRTNLIAWLVQQGPGYVTTIDRITGG